MRYKWRKWLYFDCNWKVAMEAFNETYHVFTTHPEFNKFGEFKGWAKAQGRHSNIGYDAPKGMDETKSKIRARHRRIRASRPPRCRSTHGRDQRDHHQDAGQRGQAAGRRTAGGHAGRRGASALAGLGAPRRRGARRHLADDPARHPRPERHGVADLPELPGRPGPDQRALLQRAARPELRPRQVHLRGRGLRAVPERSKSRETEWVYTPMDDRTGCRCCRRTSRTWPRCSRA